MLVESLGDRTERQKLGMESNANTLAVDHYFWVIEKGNKGTAHWYRKQVK